MGSLHFYSAGAAFVETQFARPQEDVDRVDHTLLYRLKAMIDGCPAGETIRTTIYSLTIPYMKDALIAAKNRGCTVYVLHQGSDKGLVLPDQLAAGIGTNHHWSGEGVAGDNGAIAFGPGSDLHTKLTMFTKTTTPSGTLVPNVVWMGSANMSFGSGSNLANNAIVIYNDATFYNNMRLNYWAKLWDEIPNNNFYDPATGRGLISSGAEASTTVYCSPDQDTDMWVQRLNELKFTTATPEVSIIMNKFHNSRMAVADELVRLKGLGAFIRVIGGNGAGDFEQNVRTRLINGGVLIKDGPCHDKSVIINGTYGAVTARRKIVFAGSHNCTLSALRSNDEIITKTFHDGAYDSYKAHFDYLWSVN